MMNKILDLKLNHEEIRKLIPFGDESIGAMTDTEINLLVDFILSIVDAAIAKALWGIVEWLLQERDRNGGIYPSLRPGWNLAGEGIQMHLEAQNIQKVSR